MISFVDAVGGNRSVWQSEVVRRQNRSRFAEDEFAGDEAKVTPALEKIPIDTRRFTPP
jgi:hypothetical protein